MNSTLHLIKNINPPLLYTFPSSDDFYQSEDEYTVDFERFLMYIVHEFIEVPKKFWFHPKEIKEELLSVILFYLFFLLKPLKILPVYFENILIFLLLSFN
jgi:hypothetical protein